jgi:LCP family protein required for cell wall assembly
LSYRSYSVYKAERLMRRRRRRLLFGIAGLFVTIAVVVGASYLWAYVQYQKTQLRDPTIASALNVTPETNLFPAPAGTMNILILGIDNRGWEMKRSDSMILVHADPSNNYLSVLSLPRDLWVEVPGQGMRKLNFAFANGGAPLAIQTAQKLTGVDITHYMEIDMNAFKALTDAVGGVYVDVDKRYLQQDPRYELADIPAGYQLLDGAQGLDYVRYRHDNNMDFGRQQRQQRFLAALREQTVKWDLGLKLPGLITAITDNIKTTITFEEMRNLVYWAVTKLGGGQIRQQVVTGLIQTINGESVVVADAAVLQQKVTDFATVPSAGSPATTVGTAATGDTTATTSVASPYSVDSSQFITNPDSVANASLWKQIAAQTPFKVMAPGYLPENYVYLLRNPEVGGGYDIKAGGGTKKGLKMVYKFSRENTDRYLGIMETDWLEAPAASPGRQLVYNGITYTVVGTYDQTERVWWKKDGVLYWVSNTLMHNLETEELIKVAASMMTIETGTTQ